MLRQRHEAMIEAPITTVFSKLIIVLAKSRWASTEIRPDALPALRAGSTYVQRRGSVTRRGRVVECRRPVSLILYESLSDPPCRVRLRLGWRLEPMEAGSLLMLEARYELNGAAYLNRRHWRNQIHGACIRLLERVEAAVEEDRPQGIASDSGHSSGSNSITVTKAIRVNGSPSFK